MDESSRAYGRQLARLCRGRVWIGVHYLLGNDELRRYRALQALGDRPRPAPGRLRRCADALRRAQGPARRVRRPAPSLQCRRTRQPPPAQCPAAPAQPGAAARLYPPELLAETQRIARRCRFSLDELRYEYPEEVVPPGHDARSYLRELTWQRRPRALARRRTPTAVRERIETSWR
jgi:error-prone DNA polymerase